MKELYLAGDARALTAALRSLKGVEDICAGKAVAVDGQELSGVKLVYNPKKQDICGILEAYFAVADPFAKAASPALQTAVFYASGEDVMQLEYYARFLQSRGHEPGAALGSLIVNDSIRPGQEIRPLQVRYGRLRSFTADAQNA